jgi:hypothetical protein
VSVLASDKDILALSMGPLLHEIAKLLQAVCYPEASDAERQAPKLHLWSGHDTTIMPIMSVMGAELKRWPPYCSSLVRTLPLTQHLSRCSCPSPGHGAGTACSVEVNGPLMHDPSLFFCGF